MPMGTTQNTLYFSKLATKKQYLLAAKEIFRIRPRQRRASHFLLGWEGRFQPSREVTYEIVVQWICTILHIDKEKKYSKALDTRHLPGARHGFTKKIGSVIKFVETPQLPKTSSA